MENYKEYKGYKVYEDGTIIGKYGKTLKPRKRGKYLSIRIAQGDIKKGNELWHRVVALCFIPRVDGKDFVNHKNGNRYDNRASNLEWVNRIENQLHDYKLGIQVPKRKIKI